MKTIKLSKSQDNILLDALKHGLPANLIDRVGDNQAKIITRHYNRITSNIVFNLMQDAYTAGYYSHYNLAELMELLKGKNVKLNALNLFWLLVEYCKVNKTKYIDIMDFIKWINVAGIYVTIAEIKHYCDGLSRDYKNMISSTFTKDLHYVELA